ncbi:MAG: Na+/H+ antiporter NhaA [Alphaproteobacteria bacterium]|nr:Na+/H+ antiporter NhaA [Alphaproteobacteria bacterium]
MLPTLRDFLRLEAAGGIVLALAAIAALIVANSPLAPVYQAFLDLPGAVVVGALEIRKPLLLWLNDGWMAVFFLLVGLEIKREMMDGELSDLRAAALPVVGAIGGMAVPAAIYAAINWGDALALRGWAIPTATDIAFALGVLSLLGRSVPASLKVLLTAIAIIDDLGAIAVIAVFYTDNLSVYSLALAGFALAGLAALNLAGVRSITPYALVGAVLWVCVLKSGVHATLAGVATGFAIPLKPAKDGDPSPLRWLEHVLHPWVAYLVLPAFAFANAGVPLKGLTLAAVREPVTLGIALGLLAGKQIGVLGALWLAIKAGLGRMPEGATWLHLYGLALLCGIGFTMSLFIGGLAYDDAAHGVQVRIGVLAGSILSAVLGAAALKMARPAPG